MTRTCANPECGQPFTRRGDESLGNWDRRAYCGRSCANTARRQTQMFNAGEKLAAVIEDVDWIIRTDSPDSVAARLGYAPATLERVLARVGRHDLAAWFHTAKVPS